MKTILKYLKSQRGDFVITPILAGLATIGGAGGAVGGAATVLSTAATIGSTVAKATQKQPGQKIEAPPTIQQAQGKAAQEVVKRRRAGLGYRDTILSNALNAAGMGGPGGKTMLGQ